MRQLKWRGPVKTGTDPWASIIQIDATRWKMMMIYWNETFNFDVRWSYTHILDIKMRITYCYLKVRKNITGKGVNYEYGIVKKQ